MQAEFWNMVVNEFPDATIGLSISNTSSDNPKQHNIQTPREISRSLKCDEIPLVFRVAFAGKKTKHFSGKVWSKEVDANSMHNDTRLFVPRKYGERNGAMITLSVRKNEETGVLHIVFFRDHQPPLLFRNDSRHNLHIKSGHGNNGFYMPSRKIEMPALFLAAKSAVEFDWILFDDVQISQDDRIDDDSVSQRLKETNSIDRGESRYRGYHLPGSRTRCPSSYTEDSDFDRISSWRRKQSVLSVAYAASVLSQDEKRQKSSASCHVGLFVNLKLDVEKQRIMLPVVTENDRVTHDSPNCPKETFHCLDVSVFYLAGTTVVAFEDFQYIPERLFLPTATEHLKLRKSCNMNLANPFDSKNSFFTDISLQIRDVSISFFEECTEEHVFDEVLNLVLKDLFLHHRVKTGRVHLDDADGEVNFSFLLNCRQQQSDWEIKFSFIQIDNFMKDAQLIPVLLHAGVTDEGNVEAPRRISSSSSNEEEEEDITGGALSVRVSFLTSLDGQSDDGIDTSVIKIFHVNIATTRIAVDDVVLSNLLRISTSLKKSIHEVIMNATVKTHAISRNCATAEKHLEKDLILQDVSTPRIFIESLHVSEIHIIATLHATESFHLSLCDTPLVFNPVSLSPVFALPDRLAEDLVANYIADAVLMSPALFGSLQIIGNPTAFIRSVAAGVREFIVLPSAVLEEGDFSGLVQGLGSATFSFGRHVLTGALRSITGFNSSVARNLDRLSFDNAHIEKRELRRRRVRNVDTSLWNGVEGFAESFLDAATGVLADPINGGVRNGLSGAIGGLATGVSGLVAKPLGAALDVMNELVHSSGLGVSIPQTRQQRNMRASRNTTLEASWGLEANNCRQDLVDGEA
jgi:hypothetical protein